MRGHRLVRPINFWYTVSVMKSAIHPELKNTKVHCNSCGISFITKATVDAIEVEICSNCHPFYTGKQKLVDTAGRVDKFRARSEAAQKLKAEEAKRSAAKAKRSANIDAETEAETNADAVATEDAEIKEIAQELKAETVDITPTSDEPDKKTPSDS